MLLLLNAADFSLPVGIDHCIRFGKFAWAVLEIEYVIVSGKNGLLLELFKRFESSG